MTIKEFLQKGYHIEAEWADKTNYDLNDSLLEDSDLDSIHNVQDFLKFKKKANSERRTVRGSDRYTFFDHKDNLMAQRMTVRQANRFLKNFISDKIQRMPVTTNYESTALKLMRHEFELWFYGLQINGDPKYFARDASIVKRFYNYLLNNYGVSETDLGDLHNFEKNLIQSYMMTEK